MINAHVEMDLNQHISVVSAKIIDLVKVGDEMILETLMRKFLKKYELYTPDQFMEGLTFLFSIDCLDVQDYRVILKEHLINPKISFLRDLNSEFNDL